MERTITLGVSGADVSLRESDLPMITDEELEEWGISRETLCRCFAQGVELMKGKTERVRRSPTKFGDGPDEWRVHIIGYSVVNDPLMHETNARLARCSWAARIDADQCPDFDPVDGLHVRPLALSGRGASLPARCGGQTAS
jgi:hypothetical protein